MIHCYKLCGYNIVLDIASGSIHVVDDVAYYVINTYESIIDGNDIRVLIDRVKAKFNNLSESAILDVVDDIQKLISRRKLFSPDNFAAVINKDKLAPLSALCLNVSHSCNMSCAYCFAGHGDNTYDNTNKNNKYLMDLETGKCAIDFLVGQSGDRKVLDVDFFGGEPLLNWQVIKDIVVYARELERKTGKKFRFTLTTNGLLIDDDVINFTNSQMHNVVLSLDGRPEIHDLMRKLLNDKGSYCAVVDNIKKLVKARRGKGYYIRGTFTRNNMDFVNDILHIAGLGFKEISMEPVVPGISITHGHEDIKNGKADDPPHCFGPDDLHELYKQYETLAALMLRLEKTGTGFNFYHFNLDLTGGPCVYKRINGCGVGTEYMAVTPSGELYPCHQFIGDDKFLMGDVRRGVTNIDLRNEFLTCGIFSRNECRTCWARYYCSGGCAANSYSAGGSINGIYKTGCELFKKRIECAIMMKAAMVEGKQVLRTVNN